MQSSRIAKLTASQRVVGIEPASPPWKGGVLPLYDTRCEAINQPAELYYTFTGGCSGVFFGRCCSTMARNLSTNLRRSSVLVADFAKPTSFPLVSYSPAAAPSSGPGNPGKIRASIINAPNSTYNCTFSTMSGSGGGVSGRDASGLCPNNLMVEEILMIVFSIAHFVEHDECSPSQKLGQTARLG